MNISRDFFIKPASVKQKQYEALRAFHVDNEKAEVRSEEHTSELQSH